MANPKSVQDIVDELYTPGNYIDKDVFVKYLQEHGEKMSLDGGTDSINQYLDLLLRVKNGEKNGYDRMP